VVGVDVRSCGSEGHRLAQHRHELERHLGQVHELVADDGREPGRQRGAGEQGVEGGAEREDVGRAVMSSGR
jgi:hypothetical protein